MVSQGKLPEHSVWNALVSSVCCNNTVDYEVLCWGKDHSGYTGDNIFRQSRPRDRDRCSYQELY